MECGSPFTPSGIALTTPQITETPVIDEMSAIDMQTSWASLPIETKVEQPNTTDRVSQITEDLKTSCDSKTRKPTPSPFFRSATIPNSATTLKSILNSVSTGNFVNDAPTTADVLNEIDSFEQKPLDLKPEVNLANTESSLQDPSQADAMVSSVSPKKRFIIRSQSQTDGLSSAVSTGNNTNQNQQTLAAINNYSEDYSGEIENNGLKISYDGPPIVKQEMDFSLQTNVDASQIYPNQGRLDLNPVHSTMTKGYNHSNRGKRSIESTNKVTNLMKVVHPQDSNGLNVINEVSSSTQIPTAKRVKPMIPLMNGHTNRSNNDHGSVKNDESPPNMNNAAVSEDQRKQQIRDSNREAARRCRERRRNYIEQLEADLEKQKQEIQRLTEKLNNAERENVQLRAIATEGNFLQIRRVTNESGFDLQRIPINTNGIDQNGIQRTYLNRNAH